MSAEEIMVAVMAAMDTAEEVEGPEGNDYLLLMSAIIKEANSRIENYAFGG